jgi:hypothetical protein
MEHRDSTRGSTKAMPAPPLPLDQETREVGKKQERVYYTARHLLQALSGLDESLLDLPLMLVHGKKLTKPNLVSGIIPAPVAVERTVVEEKKPSLLALADLR